MLLYTIIRTIKWRYDHAVPVGKVEAEVNVCQQSLNRSYEAASAQRAAT